jgi:uncharacterized protein (DUF433 family)
VLGGETARCDDGFMREAVELLDRIVYTMPQVDRLLRLPPGTARRWIDGYERGGRTYGPVIREHPTRNPLVTWGEFVETRLLSEYRQAGVRIFRLRGVVEGLRQELGVRYPLAYESPFLEVDGKELVRRLQDAAQIERDLRIVLTRGGQTQLTDRAADFIGAVAFADGTVSEITPDPQVPQVVIDPLRASGDPVVRAVPTEVIAEQIRAGDPPEWIAELYALPIECVEAAVRFEQRRAA